MMKEIGRFGRMSFQELFVGENKTLIRSYEGFPHEAI